jgi:hypothetical protein
VPARRRSNHRIVAVPGHSLIEAGSQNGAIGAVLVAVVVATFFPGGAGQAAALVALLLAGLLWGVRLLGSRLVPLVFPSLGAPLLMLVTYGVIRYALGEMESVARAELLLCLGTALAFFVILNNTRHRWQITALTWALTGVGLLVALGGLGRVVRQQPPDTGAVLVLQLILPVTTAMALFARQTYRVRLVFLAASLVMAATAVLSFAYSALGGMIGAGVVLAYYLIRRSTQQRWRILFVGVLLLAGLLAFLVVQHARQQSARTARLEPSAGSTDLWSSALAMGRRHLWLGGGPGMFRWLYPAYRTAPGQPAAVNNDYLQVFAEDGLVGVGLLLWVAGAFVVETYQILAVRGKRYSASTPSNRYAFAVGGLAAVAGVLVLAGWNSIFHTPGCWLTVVVIMAATLTAGVKHHSEDADDVGPMGTYNTMLLKGASKHVVAVAVFGTVVLAGQYAAKTYSAMWFHWRGDRERARLHWNTADQSYQRAWKLDRFNYETAMALGDLQAARATWVPNQRETAARQSIKWYERALTCNPYAADLLVAIGRIDDVLGRQSEALEHYQRALKADPRNAAYLAQLGLHHLRWGEQDEAIRQFRAAYELGGTDPLPELQLQRFDQLAP